MFLIVARHITLWRHIRKKIFFKHRTPKNWYTKLSAKLESNIDKAFSSCEGLHTMFIAKYKQYHYNYKFVLIFIFSYSEPEAVDETRNSETWSS